MRFGTYFAADILCQGRDRGATVLDLIQLAVPTFTMLPLFCLFGIEK